MPWVPEAENNGSARKDGYEFDWAKFDRLARIPPATFSNKQIAVAMGWSERAIEEKIKNRFNLSFGDYREALRHEVIASLFERQLERSENMKSDFGMLRWLGINLLGQSDDPKGVGREIIITRRYSNPKDPSAAS